MIIARVEFCLSLFNFKSARSHAQFRCQLEQQKAEFEYSSDWANTSAYTDDQCLHAHFDRIREGDILQVGYFQALLWTVLRVNTHFLRIQKKSIF